MLEKQQIIELIWKYTKAGVVSKILQWLEDDLTYYIGSGTMHAMDHGHKGMGSNF